MFPSSRRFLVLSMALGLAGVSSARGSAPIDFATQIQPIFAEHCVKCHGAAKAQGRMRLDSAAAVEEKWKADPKLIVAGDPAESELYQRLVLPEDSPKRMPRSAPPLPQEQIELIAAWIKAGAPLASASVAASEAPAATVPKPSEPPPLPDVPAATPEAIDRLAAAGARVTPLFAGSTLLEITFAGRGKPAGDADLALLEGVAEQVYALNLADGEFTEAGLAPLGALKNLARLHLERSNVTDAGLAHLAGLKRLQYLNLYGTEITDAGLTHLKELQQLARLYLWQAPVTYDAAMAMEKAIPGLIVNLGYDHPEVVRHRLADELERVRKRADEANAEVERLRQQLERAQHDAESANQRAQELKQQMEALKAVSDKS